MEREKRRERELNENQLEGRNAVLESCAAAEISKDYGAEGATWRARLSGIVAQAAEKGVVIQEVSRQKLDELSQTKNHQGVIALVSAHDYVEVEDILAAARAKGEDPLSSFWMASQIRIIWARFSERRNVPARMA